MSPDAEPEAIQGAYRALMRKYHPDSASGAYAEARAKRITEAYATLSDPGLRAAYDAQLKVADSPPRPDAARQGPTPPPRPKPQPSANGFASVKPVLKTRGGMTRSTWVLATIATAIVGLVVGRLLTSMPTHQSQAVFEPSSSLPASSPPPSSPPRPSTGESQATARKAAGDRAKDAKAASAAVAAIVSRDIVPRWRPDCYAGAEDLVVDVQVTLAPDGSLVSTRVAGATGDPARLVVATQSAKQAVINAAPFVLPPDSYKQWRVFIVRFDTKDVCGR